MNRIHVLLIYLSVIVYLANLVGCGSSWTGSGFRISYQSIDTEDLHANAKLIISKHGSDELEWSKVSRNARDVPKQISDIDQLDHILVGLDQVVLVAKNKPDFVQAAVIRLDESEPDLSWSKSKKLHIDPSHAHSIYWARWYGE